MDRDFKLSDFLGEDEIEEMQDVLVEENETLKSQLSKLREQLDVAIAALKKVKHNGCCIVCSEQCPACEAHKALERIEEIGRIPNETRR